MFESILAWIMNNIFAIIGVAGIGGLLGIILKKYVTGKAVDKIGALCYEAGYYIGRIVTLGLATWKYTKPVWNKIIEPYVILLLKSTLKELLCGLVKGLESDNPSLADD